MSKTYKILFATTNLAKVSRVKNLLDREDIDLLSLRDLPYSMPEPIEEAKNGVKIAELKAKHYWDNLEDKLRVLTQDDTLFLSGVSVEDNPGASIKNAVIKSFGVFNDENCVKYYAKLAAKYGGEIPLQFRYGHALYDGVIMKSSPSSLDGVLVADAKDTWTPNYPLNAVMKVNIGGVMKYYEDLTDEERVVADSNLSKSIHKLLDDLD
ncbi:MAG: hypothetical protein KGL39_28630 [Patescibacteria group bacterium]|nr:hypothetical protein [Patescibacteria group bacterium]